PTTEANTLDSKELPPTAQETHSLGIIPGMETSSWVEPSKKPAITTPMASKGIICLVKSQLEMIHSLFSPSSDLSIRAMELTAAMPITILTSGLAINKALKAVMTAPKSTCQLLSFRMAIMEYTSTSPNAPVM